MVPRESVSVLKESVSVSTKVRFGPFRSVSVPRESVSVLKESVSVSTKVRFGPFRSVSVLSGPFRSVLVNRDTAISSVVSALASGARGPGFDPRPGEENLVSEHASLRVICRDDMNTVRRPSDRDAYWMHPVQGQSPPVQVK